MEERNTHENSFQVIDRLESGELDRVEVYTWSEAQQVVFAGVLSGHRILVQEDEMSHAFLIGNVRKKSA